MRWHLRMNVVFFLCILPAFCAAQEVKQGEKDAKQPNYYPVEVGNTWHYKVNANGKDANVTTRISKLEKFGDVELALLDSPNVALTEHLTQTEKGVFRHRFNNAEVSPPFKLMPYPPKVGTKWTGEFTVEKEKGKHTYHGEILKEEMVEVPAGKYKAVLVQIKLREGERDIETNYWFVQDIGFVKQTFIIGGATILLELEKFERKKK